MQLFKTLRGWSFNRRRSRSQARVTAAVMQTLENRMLLSVPPIPEVFRATEVSGGTSTLSWQGSYQSGDTMHIDKKISERKLAGSRSIKR